MSLVIAHSGFSTPSAQHIAEHGGVTLVRDSTTQADVNWGRSTANATLNRDTSAATNKRVMREKFAAAGVPMPRLLPAEEVRAGFDGTTVTLGRPDRHSKRRGMWLVRDERTMQNALAGTRRKRPATHFMEWVESDREYRCHIFQGKSIRISAKDYSDDKTWTAIKPGEMPLATVREAARQAVAAVGLDFGAVDILARGPRNEQVWVLEVNAAPGLGGTMPRVYFDTFNRWKESR